MDEDDYEPHSLVSTIPAPAPSRPTLLAPTARAVTTTASAETPLPTPAPTPTPPLPIPLPLPRRMMLPPNRARPPARLPDMLPVVPQGAPTLLPVNRVGMTNSARGSNASTSAPARPPSAGSSSSDTQRAKVTTTTAMESSKVVVSRQGIQVENHQRPSPSPVLGHKAVPNSSSVPQQRPAIPRAPYSASRPQLPFPSASVSLPLPSPTARDPQFHRSEIANAYTAEIKRLTTTDPRPAFSVLLNMAKATVWRRALLDPSLGWVETDARIAFEIIDTHCATLMRQQQQQHQQQQRCVGAEGMQGGGASPRLAPTPSEVAFQRVMQTMDAISTARMGTSAVPASQTGPATSRPYSPQHPSTAVDERPHTTGPVPSLSFQPYASVASSAPKPSTSTAGVVPQPINRRDVPVPSPSVAVAQPAAKRPRGRPPAVPTALPARRPIVPATSVAPTPSIPTPAGLSVLQPYPVPTDIRNFPPRPSTPMAPIPIIPIAPLPAPRFRPTSSGSLKDLKQAAGIVNAPIEVPRVKQSHKRKKGKDSPAARKLETEVQRAMRSWLAWYDGRKRVKLA